MISSINSPRLVSPSRITDSLCENKFWYIVKSNIGRTLVGNKIVDHSDVVGASPVGAAPTTSSFSTEHQASLDWENCTTRRETFKFGDLVRLILEILRYVFLI